MSWKCREGSLRHLCSACVVAVPLVCGLAIPAVGQEQSQQPSPEGVSASTDSSDSPSALHDHGLALRRRAAQVLDKGDVEHAEVQAPDPAALPHLEQAAAMFAAAAEAFRTAAETAESPDARTRLLQSVARSRCDQAEALIRAGRFPAALQAVAPVLDRPESDADYRALALYYRGYAGFALQDYFLAGRSLALLAPFDHPEFGAHARYLLARTHQLCEERPEAIASYEAVAEAFSAQRKAAEEALKDPALKERPDERVRLEALVKSPPPDYVGWALFHWGAILCEQDRWADAVQRLSAFLADFSDSPLAAEAQLRIGICHVQLRQPAAAIAALQTVQDHTLLADQALRWLARAEMAAVSQPPQPPAGARGRAGPPPTIDAQTYAAAASAAIDHLKSSVVRAGQLAASDAGAKLREIETLLELGDTLQLTRRFDEAAAAYDRVLQSSPSPESAEQAMASQAAALQLAGHYVRSEELCLRFQATYPSSALLPEIAFRHAENALLSAAATEAAGNEDEVRRLTGEALTRYRQVIEQHPESHHAMLARHGLARLHYQLGQIENAAQLLAQIPDADRTGALAHAFLLEADILIRTLPSDADDALATARLMQQLERASAILSAFIIADEQGPQVPDAVIKLGYCQQRLAGLLAEPDARKRMLVQTRREYVRVLQQFPDDPLFATALLEHAKCTAQLGAYPAAIRELMRFRQEEKLKDSHIAPLALITLGDYLRATRKPAEAAALLAEVRADHESALLNDPERQDWVAMLQYGLALALRESGKPAEARALFGSVAENFPRRPEAADSLWRGGQCARDEATAQLTAARGALAAAGDDASAAKAAGTAIEQSIATLRHLAEQLTISAEATAKADSESEAAFRMHYEAAWCWRAAAEREVELARSRLQQEALEKLRQRLAEEASGSEAVLLAPEIPLTDVALQPAEQLARERYITILSEAPFTALANDVRLELAELHAERGEHDTAIALLTEALDMDPTPALAEKIRTRLGFSYLAKADAAAAIVLFNQVAANPRSPMAAHARLGAGEALFAQRDWNGTIQRLLPFREQGALRGVHGVTDRALLRLAQAYGETGDWDASRKVAQWLVLRFSQSPVLNEARYAIGLSWQNEKQYGKAIAVFSEITRRTGAEVAARAQFQIGLCRAQQARLAEAASAFLAIHYSYGYPDWSAAGLCEAASAYAELNQSEQAVKLYERVLKDHPGGRWSELARKRLAEIR